MEELAKHEWIWIAAIFALVAIAAILKYSHKIKLLLKLKGAEMNLEGANATPQAPPTSTVKGIKSRSGGFTYGDTTGQESDIQDVETETDVTITRSQGGDSPSKK